MNEIKILSAKLIKGGEKLEVKYRETGTVSCSADKTGDNKVHPDMLAAFKGLSVHLAILADYIPAKNAHKSSEIEKFFVSAYHLGGKEDNPGVVLTGYKLTSRGKAQQLNTQFEGFEQSEESRYVLMEDLQAKLDTCEQEVLLYLQEGKQAPDPQGSLFPDEQEEGPGKVTHMQIVTPDPEDIDEEEVDDFPDDEKPEKPKRGKGLLPQADKGAMARVSGEWTAEEYEKEIGKGKEIDEAKEKAASKKRGRQVKKK